MSLTSPGPTAAARSAATLAGTAAARSSSSPQSTVPSPAAAGGPRLDGDLHDQAEPVEARAGGVIR